VCARGGGASILFSSSSLAICFHLALFSIPIFLLLLLYVSLCESAGSVVAPWVLENFVQLFEFDITTTVDTALAVLVGINRSIERRWMEQVEGGSFS
jgi:hypothetical protein